MLFTEQTWYQKSINKYQNIVGLYLYSEIKSETLTISDAADLLGVTIQRVHQYIKKGIPPLPAKKASQGKAFVIDKNEFIYYVIENEKLTDDCIKTSIFPQLVTKLPEDEDPGKYLVITQTNYYEKFQELCNETQYLTAENNGLPSVPYVISNGVPSELGAREASILSKNAKIQEKLNLCQEKARELEVIDKSIKEGEQKLSIWAGNDSFIAEFDDTMTEDEKEQLSKESINQIDKAYGRIIRKKEEEYAETIYKAQEDANKIYQQLYNLLTELSDITNFGDNSNKMSTIISDYKKKVEKDIKPSNEPSLLEIKKLLLLMAEKLIVSTQFYPTTPAFLNAVKWLASVRDKTFVPLLGNFLVIILSNIYDIEGEKNTPLFK